MDTKQMTPRAAIAARKATASAGASLRRFASRAESAETGTAAFKVIRPGRNVWKTAKADRLSFLVDGAAYFSALDQALRQAKKTIWIVGWDFNPDIRLKPRQSSETLGELLRSLADDNPDLTIRILVWGMGPVYSGKSLRLFGDSDFSRHPQITLRFDLKHPLRACHHQKLVAIDDSIGFLGGIDLTARRWDEPDHRPDNALRRSPEGEPYGPVHDMQAMASGEAARLIADVARRRWRHATGETVMPDPAGPEASSTPWPTCHGEELADVHTAIALTEPGLVRKRGRYEAFRLTRDAIRAARRSIYIETQYLASFGVAREIAKRLREDDGPEILVLVTRSSHGFIEKLAMGNNRDRLIRRLKRIDRHDRLRVVYPIIRDEKGEEQEIIIHSKLIIVDDYFLRIGSSNLNNRSEGLDTECDMALEVRRPDQRKVLTGLRDRLLSEHLAVPLTAVQAKMAETGSIIRSMDALNTCERGVRDFAVDLDKGEIHPMPGTGIVDPRLPFRPLSLLRQIFVLRFRMRSFF